jgi:hypothetical protein
MGQLFRAIGGAVKPRSESIPIAVRVNFDVRTFLTLRGRAVQPGGAERKVHQVLKDGDGEVAAFLAGPVDYLSGIDLALDRRFALGPLRAPLAGTRSAALSFDSRHVSAIARFLSKKQMVRCGD